MWVAEDDAGPEVGGAAAPLPASSSPSRHAAADKAREMPRAMRDALRERIETDAQIARAMGSFDYDEEALMDSILS